MHLELATRITEKLYQKGDFEKVKNKEISLNCNREKDKIEDILINYFDKIAMPSFSLLNKVLDRYNSANGVSKLKKEKHVWEILWEENIKDNRRTWIGRKCSPRLN